jgi:hypothetical protein
VCFILVVWFETSNYGWLFFSPPRGAGRETGIFILRLRKGKQTKALTRFST